MTAVNTADTQAALAGAAAVIRCLPAADLTPGEALSGAESLAQAIAVPGSKAVTANLSGDVNGVLVLILSPELATQVENGPVGPQDLVAGLEPALTDATAALGESLGTLHFEAPQSLDAEIAIENAASYSSVTMVALINAEGPVGALVVLIAHPSTGTADAASFETLSGALGVQGTMRGVELLNDVEMGVTAELGRTRMTVRELLSLTIGAVVELDRAAGSPVDLLVNGTLVARGEVVVIDEEFGVRVTEIIGYDSKKAK